MPRGYNIAHAAALWCSRLESSVALILDMTTGFGEDRHAPILAVLRLNVLKLTTYTTPNYQVRGTDASRNDDIT
jgi:hypothetical protein